MWSRQVREGGKGWKETLKGVEKVERKDKVGSSKGKRDERG